jgi:mannitol-1-/sugar-/sorbitol-6-phosphatase
MLFHAQALLVDIDGTLVDSTAMVVASWPAWAATHQLDVEEILRVCHGRRTQDTVAMFLPAEQVPPATRDLEELELAALDGVTALPGADVLLQELPSDRLGRPQIRVAGVDARPAGRRWPAGPCSVDSG